jgi:hypothetical protein
MKTTANYLLGAACAAALASCYTYQPPPQGPSGPSLDNGPGQSRYWNGPIDDPAANGGAPIDPAAIAAPNPTIDPNLPPGTVQPNTPGGTYTPATPTGGSNATVGVPTQPQVQPAPTPAPPPTVTPAKPSSLPVGIKVNGKPGFVYSPYDKTAGIVDVQGMAPGTKVKCPYTGKVFIVP